MVVWRIGVVVLVWFAVMTPPSLGCGVSIDPVEWSQQGDFWIRQDNVAGVVSVFRGSKDGEPEWTVRLKNFSARYSRVLVNDTGAYLLHYKRVARTKTDVALTLYGWGASESRWQVTTEHIYAQRIVAEHMYLTIRPQFNATSIQANTNEKLSFQLCLITGRKKLLNDFMA